MSLAGLTGRVALLLFGSGFCALVYQIAWLRLLRLVFGASTTASAAVLAVFLAGLGAGSLVLGRRADATSHPLAFYARLEVGVALAAAASPWLVELTQGIYLGLGGTSTLGTAGGNSLRLVLAVLVLGLPTFLMGGTLPAVARAVTRSTDAGRRRVALLLGANTLGAVCGALVTTFVALEALGVRKTIWAASGLNLGVALTALALATRHSIRSSARPTDEHPATARRSSAAPQAKKLVLISACAVGFVFLLMELVWYRMLAPLLGGSSYTFGLILAVALLGVGLGGLLYAAGPPRRRPTLTAFASTCAAEALCIALPYALGDRIAVMAMLLRPVGDVSFALLVGSWIVLTVVVVLPAAIVAGYQFPLLVALLGESDDRVGQDVGLAYAWNTAGTILGSIAGGFGLLPLLSAPGAWVFAAALLVGFAALAWWKGRGWSVGGRPSLGPVTLGVAAVLLLSTAGPSAVWRHTPTGAGGMPSTFAGPNEVRQMSQAVQRAIVWQRDGRESSVAIHELDEISLLLNGKADGSALRDAPTQVLSGLVGAALHPQPRRALVIGLGTGSSAGWLAAVDSVEQVDVVELEPAILEVARRCAPVNHAVLEHPKARLWIGDGREHLLTTDERYDVIFSEPSNPYRAGIASLFTEELYHSAAARLGEGGIFLQWLQSYHVDSQVVRTVLATMVTAFPHVESWQVHQGDMLLVASRSPIDHDLGRLRRRLAREPFASALQHTLGVAGAEGLYTAFVASADFARAVHKQETGRFNTDDHPIIEFGFARGLGRDLEFDPQRLGALAAARGENVPVLTGGSFDWRQVLEFRSARNAKWGLTTSYPATSDQDFDRRISARNAYVLGDLAAALHRWRRQSSEAATHIDRLMLAEALAQAGDPAALDQASALAENRRLGEAAAVRARAAFTGGDAGAARQHLVATFLAARQDPWIHRPTLERALALAGDLARRDKSSGPALFDALSKPFSVRLLDEARLRTRIDIARVGDFETLCASALAPLEPHVPWEQDILTFRARCYAAIDHPLQKTANDDLEQFIRRAPPVLEIGH
ncbi:MAG: fused MFS/spermidine synthase [Acidobacteriota bacterium]